MKNLKQTGILCILLTLSTFASAQTFKIEGRAEGLADKTWLYVTSASNEATQKVIDSTQIVNGKFTIEGKLDEPIVQMVLYTSKYANYVFFWVENKQISMELKDGEFKKGTIKGSATQIESEYIDELIVPVKQREDSLRTLLSKATDTIAKNDLRKKISNIKNEEYDVYLGYAKEHANSLVIAYISDVYSSTWGKAKTENLYHLLSPAIQQSRFGKNISNFIALNQEIKIGGKFVDFEQANVTAKIIKLSGIKAKYILLEFWGSWCRPCRQENPNLVKTYTAFKNKGFEILGVAADNNKAQWLKAIKDDLLPWENVSDLKGDKNEAALAYGISAYPTNYLIDDKGIIIAKDLRGDDLTKKLAELLP